jgi:3',5'-cyclic AMP phosphodiesterase CpdA
MTNDPARDDRPADPTRRHALRCLAFGGGGTLFMLAGGVVSPASLASALMLSTPGRPLFVQLSDTHIGFHKDANPDVARTLALAVDQVNALPMTPSLTLHTGDITHLSKPEEFDLAAQLLGSLKTTELHTVPGEHDVADADARNYFERYGAASGGRGYYSFDHSGVHFLALNNVMHAADGGLGALGEDQVAWALADLKARTSSTPIVVFAHMPLWSVWQPWGWGTADVAPVIDALRRFGSATVLNGHIHQVVQKVEGHITFHTARSTAYPQPAPGSAPGPGPLTVPGSELAARLGVTAVSVRRHPTAVTVVDTTLAAA